MSRYDVKSDPILGEEVWLSRSETGLPLRVVPTERFRESVAVISFRYGSTDLGFSVDGREHQSPEGVAHYLEHKLFEDEDLHVFERFGRRGASVNAMTGFAKTTYYFQATSRFEENFDDLLRLVSQAHLTAENVEKERGIIAQEIRMYEDAPEYRGFFDLLGCFYREHPARHPVAGTVESIQGIDAAELEACYDAFYRTSNAALAVAGPIDPETVLAMADACKLAAGQPAQGRSPEDLGAVVDPHSESRMDVTRPRLLLGFKERSLISDPLERRRREITSGILLDRLFGGASDVRESLHERGLVDDSLSTSYTSEASFGFAVVGCETEQPESVVHAIREVFAAPSPITDDDLDRARRRVLGRYVRSFDNVQSLAFGHGQDALDGLEPFATLAIMDSLTVEEVAARQVELCRDDSFAHAVVCP